MVFGGILCFAFSPHSPFLKIVTKSSWFFCFKLKIVWESLACTYTMFPQDYVRGALSSPDSMKLVIHRRNELITLVRMKVIKFDDIFLGLIEECISSPLGSEALECVQLFDFDGFRNLWEIPPPFLTHSASWKTLHI